jgi:AraC-like DNA-binding protein
VQRIFQSETGLRFAQWRQRLRLLHAVTLLGNGCSVTRAGQESGYASTSAFVAAFRKQLGETPMRYRLPVPQPTK